MKRITLFLLVFLACAVVAAGFVQVTKADAVTGQKICLASNPDDTCWFGATTSAKKFRNGYFQRAHGVDFAHPRMVRSVFINKIERRFKYHPAEKRAVMKHLGLTKAACTTNYCVASRGWSDVMNRLSCLGHGYPATGTKTCDAVPPATNSDGFLGNMTKKGVQRGGAVIICGGAVVFGVLSDGAASPAVVGIWGGLGCGWSFWSSFG